MFSPEEYNDNIDAYLKGGLSPEEVESFKTGLNSDPSLKSEFLFQQSLISGIQASRKAELKARLNNIPVSATGPTLWKYGVLAGIIATFFVAANYFPTSLFKNDKSDIHIATSDKLENLGEVSVEEKMGINSSGNISTSPLETVPMEIKQVPSGAETKKSKKIEIDKDSGKDMLPNLPDIHSPEALGNEHVGKEVETPDHSLTKTKHINTTVAGVEVVKSKKHKFHYQYFENKLFLYGDFDTKTYDILELNNSKGQKLYLKFESNYYELQPDKREVSRLELVKNKDLLKELEEIQSK